MAPLRTVKTGLYTTNNFQNPTIVQNAAIMTPTPGTIIIKNIPSPAENNINPKVFPEFFLIRIKPPNIYHCHYIKLLTDLCLFPLIQYFSIING